MSIKNYTNTNARHSQGNTGWLRRSNRKVMQITFCALFPNKNNTDKVNEKEVRAKEVIKRNYLCCALFIYSVDDNNKESNMTQNRTHNFNDKTTVFHCAAS